jgi:biotin carboxyl carrier protein
MISRALTVLASTDADGGTTLHAPKLGIWSDHPRDGAVVMPGSEIGTLTQAGRRYSLLIPAEVAGRVAISGTRQDALPVEYLEALCRVIAMASSPVELTSSGIGAAQPVRGALAITAPTDGVFYRSSSAGAKPFVAVGERIGLGRPVGLIEVMKTFNPIAYGGAGFPDEAEVVEIVAADGQEVRAGQALVVVKKP